jgi:hypothetical protein
VKARPDLHSEPTSNSEAALWLAVGRVLREADEADRAARPDLHVVEEPPDDD